MFGPTETTIWSTMPSTSRAGETGPVPIGRPIANTVCRILDPAGELCPIGVAGELHIGGVGVTARLSAPAGADRRAVRRRSLCATTGAAVSHR